MELNTSLISIKGIGEKTAGLFAKLHITQIGQLLEYFPRDYEFMEAPVTVSELTPGKVCAVKAAVIGMPSTRRFGSLSVTTVQAGDRTGLFRVAFFGMPYLRNVLKPGSIHVFRGLCNKDRKAVVQMDHPKLFKEEEYRNLQSTLQPKYALTAGLTNHSVGKAVQKAMEGVTLTEVLPTEILEQYRLTGYEDAIRKIHFPGSYEELALARRRLVFDEFLFFFLSLHKLQGDNKARPVNRALQEAEDTGRLIDNLPYELTAAQKKVWDEIRLDLLKDTAMNRLVQGDVGSGKTILAFLSLLMCAANGRQGCLMAPTEVLAKQHFEAMEQLSAEHHLCVRAALLTGSMTAKEKRETYARIAQGDVNVIIGTHALIQEKVEYQDLALVVTDEQHRFGVRQRETLAGKGQGTHILVMSATPIPRTLAIVLYGDLHVSILDELPAGRAPIKNCVVGTQYRKTAYEFLQKEIAAGHQAYVICPMVEEGESDGLENVLDYTVKLQTILPQSIHVASLHGKMKPAEKNRIMEEFSRGNIQILVSTTVIEVGINVPNATVMMVENAERFGLAQLHQLRGRVGRGKAQSYCIFVSGNESEETMKRLEILKSSNDGFFIANEDLRMRGPGDMFGVRQSGLLAFRLGDIYQDSDLLLKASALAEEIEKDAAEGGGARWEACIGKWDNMRQYDIDFTTI